MSLLDSESRPCTVMIKAGVSDGQGGTICRYINGVHFYAVVSPDGAGTVKALGNTEMSAKTYKFFYPNRISLKLNDIVKTLDDGKTYKVKVSETPPAKSASVQFSLVTAEEWEMPDE